MASPNKICLTVEGTGVLKFRPQNAETAAKTSELLQENHEKHHIYFNESGFHNHIVHHLLTLYGLGAPASVIERQYKDNSSYQKPQFAVEDRILKDMSNPEHFKRYLGQQAHYQDFLVFFQNEMEKKGWENVVNEYLFAGDERADDILGRMYAGLLHPIIHFGFGVEFKQPAIIAESFAQACVHNTWMGNYLLSTEAAHKSKSSPSAPSKTLPELLDAIRADGKLATAAKWEDSIIIRDGILKRAPDELLKYATQWKVSESNLEEKTAEMINAVIYFSASAQNPSKQVKFDFSYIHSLNSSIFWPTFNSQSWISPASKGRLLQWKGYLDLTVYASRGTPKLLLEEVANYVPKEPGSSWDGIFDRLFEYQDAGHAVKLGRAVAYGERIGEKYEGKEWMRVKGELWEKIGNMAIDSVEDTGGEWVAGAGFREAWEKVEDRPNQAHL